MIFAAVVTSFVGSGESGFHDDVGMKAMLSNPQQLEIESLKQRLFLSDTVCLQTVSTSYPTGLCMYLVINIISHVEVARKTGLTSVV